MFVDYYQVLGIEPTASLDEIKAAYRTLSKKWHPDVNPHPDATRMMIAINKAYAVLKDPEQRVRYNREYQRFKNTYKDSKSSEQEASPQSQNKWEYNYEFADASVKDDMQKAHDYASALVRELLNRLKEDSKRARKGAWEEARGYVWAAIIITIIGLIAMLFN